MWAGISALLTLLVMVYKSWLDMESKKEADFEAQKKAISDAVASGDVSAINSIVQQLRR